MKKPKDYKDFFTHKYTGEKVPRIKLTVPYRELKDHGFSYFKYYANNYIMYSKEYQGYCDGLNGNCWKMDGDFIIDKWGMWTRKIVDYINNNHYFCFLSNKDQEFSFHFSHLTGDVVPMEGNWHILWSTLFRSDEELIKQFGHGEEWIKEVRDNNKEFLKKYPFIDSEEKRREFNSCHIKQKDFDTIINDLKILTNYFDEKTA